MRLQEITYEKTQRILGFLLPSFVKKKVKDGVRYIAEDQGTVTVLFCDISDFDTIIADYSTSELVTFLDTFYQRLDILCITHGVSKIETVGKTYMACSGLKDSELEMDASITSLHHSKRALNLAFAIIEETKKISLKSGSRLEVKIGLHSGQVTAGVVGYHKPQFSLVGDTVNTASRMCSTLEIGNAIQISTEIYENAPEFLSNKFSPNRINAKGKGILDTFVYSANGPWECWNFLDELTSYKTSSAISSVFHTEKTENRSATREKGMMGFLDETFRMDTVYLQSSKCCFCTFTESDKERRFRMDKLESNKDFMKFGLVVCFCYYLVTLGLELSHHAHMLKSSFQEFLLRIFTVFLFFVLVLAFKKHYKSRAYGAVIYVIILLVLADLLLMSYNLKHDFLMTTTSFFYQIVILNHLSGYSYTLICWLEIPLLFFWLAFALLFERSEFLITTTLFLVLFSFINTLAVYIRENQLRNYFNLKALTEKDMAKTEKLLIQMMPPHVLENMKNNKTFTDKLYDVTLLYADIVGFTSWSSNKTPKEVVEMLSNLFTRFDKLCVIHKVYKVHTIGDCYVVMGYLEGKERDPHNECNSVVNMALSMISVIDKVNREKGIDLKMRIGIHTGSIIAGIIGTNIVRYDIYGPDVLIANKMESCGEPGKINISDVTKRYLTENCLGDYSFTVNKEIVLKSISRKHLSYFLSVN
jgi:class 3 adenylate cyclase